MTQDDRVEISMLKARQQELKRFFSVVGGQQVDILEQLANRDLSKVARKPKAHRHVPEYDTVTEFLELRLKDTQSFLKSRYRFEVEQEQRRMEREVDLIEQQFKVSLARQFCPRFPLTQNRPIWLKLAKSTLQALLET